MCADVAVRRVSRQARRALGSRLISAKNQWILPKTIKESVDLPDFIKESVAQIQILCTFQADFSHVSKSGVRLFPYYLLTYIMPPLYKR